LASMKPPYKRRGLLRPPRLAQLSPNRLRGGPARFWAEWSSGSTTTPKNKEEP
jgi:hypothetical protein